MEARKKYSPVSSRSRGNNLRNGSRASDQPTVASHFRGNDGPSSLSTARWYLGKAKWSFGYLTIFVIILLIVVELSR